MLPTALEHPQGIEMVSVCTVPARGGRSCERFGGYKTINRIPFTFIGFGKGTIANLSKSHAFVKQPRQPTNEDPGETPINIHPHGRRAV